VALVAEDAYWGSIQYPSLAFRASRHCANPEDEMVERRSGST
jgi:hypothetical protein